MYYNTIILYHVQEQSFSWRKNAFYIENQSVSQPCNVHVSGLTENCRPYRRDAGLERYQKYTYVSKVYTEHIRSKMRPLKPVCVTEMTPNIFRHF